jgi:uncharacterized membrane protein
VSSVSLLLALLATGLLAGFLNAFAAAVNFGLGELDNGAYIAAMQSINDAIPNGVFVISFVGAPLLLVHLLLAPGSPRSCSLARSSSAAV